MIVDQLDVVDQMYLKAPIAFYGQLIQFDRTAIDAGNGL